MTPRRHDPIVAAILAQIEIVDRTLMRLCVPASARDDLRQDVTLSTWRAAQEDRIAWRDPPSMRVYIRVAARRRARRWHGENEFTDELREDHATDAPSAERVLIARNLLAFLRRSTGPHMWRAVIAQAKGIRAEDVADRERVPRSTIANRIRLARADFAAALAREDAAIYVRRKI